METLMLTPSRKARLIVAKVLEYAELGGMEPPPRRRWLASRRPGTGRRA